MDIMRMVLMWFSGFLIGWAVHAVKCNRAGEEGNEQTEENKG